MASQNGQQLLCGAGGEALLVSDSLVHSYNQAVQDALQKHKYNFVFTDPALPDHPIVYASEGFLEMSGYSREEVLGKNCRFLQGPGTDKRTILEIREAIRDERPCQVKLLNYTKSGKPFWNLFHLAPVYSQKDGRVVHFVGVQTPISSRLAAAIQTPVSLQAEDLDKLTIAGREEGTINSGGESSDEEECNVSEEDKQKAFEAVKCVLSQIAESSNKGLGARRSKSFTEGSTRGTVCTSLMLSLTRIQQSFVLADPHLPDMPIVHASDMFLTLTGYSREEVVGRNCRFLQGPGTDPEAIEQIRSTIKAEKPCTVRILNYRKNKQAFWNFLHIAPVRNANGKVAFYTGVQLDVTLLDEGDDEAQQAARMKQMGAVGAIRVAVRGLRAGGGAALRRVHTFS